jgi:acyl-CoA dehydrogenase
MREYPIARSAIDARVTRVYGGTSEIMREIIGRDLNLARKPSRTPTCRCVATH